jgi:hypothetical protein
VERPDSGKKRDHFSTKDGNLSMSKTARIEYDDDVLNIIVAVNEILKDRKLEVIFDGEEHDGFEIILLKDLS